MIVVRNDHPTRRFSANVARSTIELVLKDQKKRRGISVVFVNHYRMRKINREYLDHDYSTDVIAFDVRDDVWPDGELYVNLDRARSQANEYRVTLTEEVRRLLIHGTLHLLGHEDSNRAGRLRMNKLETRYLRMCQQ